MSTITQITQDTAEITDDRGVKSFGRDRRSMSAKWKIQEQDGERTVAELSAIHAPNSKGYFATLRRVTEHADGSTSFMMFQDDARIAAERTPRYKAADLGVFFQSAIEKLIAAQTTAQIAQIIEAR
jgi:hypothetical protein